MDFSSCLISCHVSGLKLPNMASATGSPIEFKKAILEMNCGTEDMKRALNSTMAMCAMSSCPLISVLTGLNFH